MKNKKTHIDKKNSSKSRTGSALRICFSELFVRALCTKFYLLKNIFQKKNVSFEKRRYRFLTP